MLHGIVTAPVIDLRAAPEFKSERLSQALFGTPIEIIEPGKEYSRIRLIEGYRGWSKNSHIMQINYEYWKKYLEAPKYVVKSNCVIIKNKSKKRIIPHRLYFGTRLILSEVKCRTYFTIPSWDKIRIEKKFLKKIPRKISKGITGETLVKTAERFLGAPYLWGGITPAGFDCSGLVQSVCRFHSLEVPRDSKDQRDVGFAIERHELKPGDLLFFEGHVAISRGGLDIIHANLRRGMVSYDLLDPQSPIYRKDLDDGFLFARRLSL
ncbi:MAG: NlpC/P60 family protein [candidate division Zixibacteria bacterium]